MNNFWQLRWKRPKINFYVVYIECLVFLIWSDQSLENLEREKGENFSQSNTWMVLRYLRGEQILSEDFTKMIEILFLWFSFSRIVDERTLVEIYPKNIEQWKKCVFYAVHLWCEEKLLRGFWQDFDIKFLSMENIGIFNHHHTRFRDLLLGDFSFTDDGQRWEIWYINFSSNSTVFLGEMPNKKVFVSWKVYARRDII